MKNFNELFAIKATRLFGSMYTFWLFCIWAFLPLIPFFSNFKNLILYISSGFIQLVALPLILVGQELLGRNAEERAVKDHQILNEQYKNILMMMDDLKHLHKDTHKLLKENIED